MPESLFLFVESVDNPEDQTSLSPSKLKFINSLDSLHAHIPTNHRLIALNYNQNKTSPQSLVFEPNISVTDDGRYEIYYNYTNNRNIHG